MIRPRLKIGDIVKLSKKGRNFGRRFPKDSTLVVSDILGDGIDQSSRITCRVEIKGAYQHVQFYRSELWSTGANAFTGAKNLITGIAPSSNDGRTTCFICGETTYKHGGVYHM